MCFVFVSALKFLRVESDSVGQISISVHRLPKNVEVVRWFNLERRFEYDKVQGQIELKLLLITNEVRLLPSLFLYVVLL